MKLDFYLEFVSPENNWVTNEPFQTIVEAVELSDNAILQFYQNGTVLMHISLPNNVWHVYSNRPLEMDQVKDLNQKDAIRVNVIH